MSVLGSDKSTPTPPRGILLSDELIDLLEELDHCHRVQRALFPDMVEEPNE